MNPVHVRHVRDFLERTFQGRIDLDDMRNQPPEGRQQAFLSRALAGFAVQHLTGWDPDRAAATVIDGWDDNGIDAVAVDTATPHLRLVQAKWSDRGRASLDLKAALALIEGWTLISNNKYERFNARFQALAERVDEVMGDTAVRITLVIALMGESRLADNIRLRLDEECAKLNEIEPTMDMVVLGLPEFHQAVREGIAERKVDLTAGLDNFGRLTEPYLAYYGTMPAADVAGWYEQHGERLFTQNIRRSLGLTQVNRGLIETLHTQPEHFWYYNNGITVLCDSIRKAPRNATTVGAAGEFRVTGASVVNGAQTVAGIHAALRDKPEAAGTAAVWVRLISLEDCPDGFATAVTQATNTQNQVEARDFVALEDYQARLRDDFALSLSKTYVIKRGETEPSPDTGCSVVEAAVALACAHRDSGLAVHAKHDPERLWSSGPNGAYADIFGSQPTAEHVWRRVQVLREVRRHLEATRGDREGRTAAIATHGDLLVAHLVFQLLRAERRDGPNEDWADVGPRVPHLAAEAFGWLRHLVDDEFGSSSHIISIFKNPQRCGVLAGRALPPLRAGQPAPDAQPAPEAARQARILRKPNAVPTLVDAARLRDGTVLEFRAVTGPEREALTRWIAERPQRGRATWRNHNTKPLLWQEDGKHHSPSALVTHMLRLAAGPVPKAIQGTTRWFVPGEGSIADLADQVRGGGTQ